VDEKVVAVVGVANKESDYDQSDVRRLTLLMDATWKIVEHNRVEDERKKNAKILEELYNKEREERLELEEEAKARGMFIDVLAHELRTPLTPIMISTGMLRDTLKPDSAEITQKLTRNVINSAEVLSHRLEELLEIAKYSRGTFKLNLHPVDIARLMGEIVTRFKPYLDQHDQQLTTRIAGDLPRAFLDPSRIEQVMINLLSNASKFSPENGNISLTARLHNNELLVEVQDNGIGISPDEQQRLFQPYHRVEQDRQKFPGIGLGLTVAKQIVEAHGGKIWLTSRPDEGSTFHFTLPLRPLAEKT
jgi:signal transduction histidine kinase